MSNIIRVRQAGIFGQALSIEEQVIFDALLEYSKVGEKDFQETAIAKRPILPIVQRLCAYGHHIYMKVETDINGEEIEGSRVFYMDDGSFITERRLGMPQAVSISDPNIDYAA
jgi:hypothetical protein